ncbi:olfactory receptor 5P81-like [Mixophyes fleayi]|uniref:olfactory receptor 5P81-like n=1 Tax=Mixophyes fleayi TaxID=3061075 RepID=UPI003F4E1369
MCEDNQTEVTVFLLLGFQGLYKYKILLFIVFLLSYIVVLNGNLVLVVLVSTSDHLKTPMFIFLKHLAISDVLITTTIIPMMLDIILRDERVVSITSCVIQQFLCLLFGALQCFLIVIMSYDRFLAICNPMRYNSIMVPQVCLKMIVGSWLLAFILSSEIIMVCQLRFCGLNYIDHFFCDLGSIVGVSSSDTSILLLVDFVISILIFFIPFFLIIITYIIIFFTILNISSKNGRKKAFSTCSSHLTTVCAYYGTLMTVFLAPSDKSSLNTNKFRSLLYIVVTPMMNPIIYSLRNHEIRRTLQKSIVKIKLQLKTK